ncbi:hypothetical protein [Chondrinema litorale]|uniref:hypothetical protein n=1 Tax=Chondrinema litorale TaxID=2994555 RepID=UPI002542AD9C|nr:hypothetical protein [Chondrinema litorale]UZR98954.1 hypothetical protein OQ292_34455 [Chondrinema litorale]
MKNNMYKIGFFILIVVNIILVFVFIYRPKSTIHQNRLLNEISNELAFTEMQKEMFEEMAKTHSDTIRNLKNQEVELVSLIFEQLSSTDHSEKEATLQKILDLEKSKIMVTYNHFEELKAICNETQLANFDKVVDRIVPVLTGSKRK